MIHLLPRIVLNLVPYGSASIAEFSGAGSWQSFVRPVLDSVELLLVVLALGVIIALARRNRRIDVALAACATARAHLEALDRLALPAVSDPQAMERALNRRGAVDKARSDASVRAVAKAGPARPEWKDAYSIGLQLVAAGQVDESLALLRDASPQRLLPRWLFGAVPHAVVEYLWSNPDRISRGCENLECAVLWAKISREAATIGKTKVADEASANARRLFRESLRWLPEEDDIPVHLKNAEFLRERQEFQEAIKELDKAESKARKLVPAGAVSALGPSGVQAPLSPAPAFVAAYDLLAEVVGSRASLRLQILRVPDVSPAAVATPMIPVSIDSEASKSIERDLSELERIKSLVSDKPLATVRRAALLVRYERFKGDESRANAAAAEGADLGTFSANRIDGSGAEPPRLSLSCQSSLAAELRWAREDQLLLASLRMIVVRARRDAIPASVDGFSGRRAFEDFIEAVTFAWLHYDQRRILELPTLQAALASVSSELDDRARDFRSGDLWDLHGWLDYVRARSQIRPLAPVVPTSPPTPTVVAPIPVAPPLGGFQSGQVSNARLASASLFCRVANSPVGFSHYPGRIEVLADHNVVSEDWAREGTTEIDLSVTDGEGHPLRKVGVFGFPTADLKFPVSLTDIVELSGGLQGKACRIATVDLGGLSKVPKVIRFSVRSRYGAREFGTADFPSSAFSIAPPTTREVSIDDARPCVFALTILWAYLLRISGKSSMDRGPVMALRDMLHGELGDEGLRALGVSLREGAPPAVLDVEFVQSIVSFLERLNPSEERLREMAMAAWQQISRRPDLRAALEHLMRRVPVSVLSDAAMQSVGLPRPAVSGARPTAVEPGSQWNRGYLDQGISVAPVASAVPVGIASGGVEDSFFAEIGVSNPLQNRAQIVEGLLALSQCLSSGGLDPARASRIRALIALLEESLRRFPA